MSKQAHLADGTVLEFPDDTPDHVIDASVKGHLASGGNDSALEGFVKGVQKPLDNMASWLGNTQVGQTLDDLGEKIGLPRSTDVAAYNNVRRGENSRTGWQAAGNFAGTLPTVALPGGVLAQGAASGALLSDADTLGGVATDATIGAVTSKLGEKALRALGGVVAPKISPDIRRLADAGVRNFTPGQLLHGSTSMIGRAINKGEEALTSVPLVGDIINLAREGGTNAYEHALGNRVLSNIGQKLPQAMGQGEAVVNHVKKAVGDAYDSLVPHLSMNFDQPFMLGLADAKNLVATVPDAIQNQFESIVRNAFTNRVNPTGNGLAGQSLKDAEAFLTKQIRTYAPKGGDHGYLADALAGVRQSLRDAIVRHNPQLGNELQALNKAWAQLRPMSLASKTNPAGQITPAQMFSQVRRTGFDDPLVKSGAKVMRNTTPDSGTARRAMAGVAALGSGTLGLATVLSPSVLAPASLGALYLPKALKLLNQLALAKRNQAASAVGDAARFVSKGAGAAFPALGKFLQP